MSGPPNCFSGDTVLLGAANNGITIDPTLVDAASIELGTKVAINTKAVITPGYHGPSGTSGAPGKGIFVTGVL